jgi:hypothetical protein
MNNELLTLLNANGIDIDHIPGGAHGWLDREAILMALQGATRAELALALYSAGEEKEHSPLWGGLFMAACETEEYQQRFLKRCKGKLDVLCQLAIYEFTHMPHCKSCNGTGLDEKYENCKPCGGTGTKRISNRAKSSVVGKCHTSWYQFSGMYAELLRILQGWQDSNLRKLNKRLKNEE